MSVLHLLGTAGDGGAETYFVDLVAALKRAGVGEAAAIRGHPAREAALKAAGIPVKVLRFGGLGGYYNLKYYAGFDELVANTEDIAEWIVGQGWPAGRVRCIPNFAVAPPKG